MEVASRISAGMIRKISEQRYRFPVKIYAPAVMRMDVLQ
jgi:hypothetical protein